MSVQENDVVFYTDSGSVFTASPEPHFCLMEKLGQDVVVFSSGLKERAYSKRSALLLMNCGDFNNCSNTMQRMTGALIVRKSLMSLSMISHWMAYNADRRIVDEHDDDEQLAKAEHGSWYKREDEKFIANRHDQTVMSIVSKKYQIPEWPDPSQYGDQGYNQELKQMKQFRSIQNAIIQVTRDKN